MDLIAYQEKKPSRSSRKSFNCNLQRVLAALVLLVMVPGAAVAQYPGNGGTGSAGYPSYGSKGVVIGAVAGGAAAAGLLYWKLHSRSKVQGCLAGNGDKLVNDKTNETYSLTNKQNATLTPGEHVLLFGKKAKDSSGEPIFEVHKLSKDLGQCTATTAEQRQGQMR